MNRCVYFVFLILAGCQMPLERLPLRPLPEDAPPLPYAELLTRARLQASTANEAFYVNQWSELEDSAKGLEQTARFLEKAVEVPKTQKEALPAKAKDLSEEAARLQEAAKAKNVQQTLDTLQRVHFKIRLLRLDE